MKNKKTSKLIVILGPTASGKSELAIKLAKKFDGEIVSADSRQIYKEMDIATAKPITREFARINHEYARIVKGVPHYLIDVVWPNQEFNVAIYKKMAIKAIKDIQKRGEIPFLVGGTGLYIKAIVDNIEFPKVPAQKRLREKLEKKTVKELFEIYKELDHLGARFIEKKNKRRLIRAIEVCKVTKKPFWQQRERGKLLFDTLQIGIKLPKNKLKKRVETRVEKMFKMGLEKEVKKLIKKHSWNLPPLQTIGYQEWKDFFDKKEVKNRIILHTIQFAKRQMTWFKRNKQIKWIKNTKEAEKLIKEFIRN
jgi:tRNA dimethylallyltransferase